MRISLKKPTEPVVAENQPTEHQPQAVLNRAFSQEELIRAWKSYAETEDNDTHLKYTILSILPKIGEQNKIFIETVNPDQQQKLKDKSPEIHAFLSQQLQNNQISLQILLVESTSAATPFVGKELYQFMAEKRPELVDLVNEFQLRLAD